MTAAEIISILQLAYSFIKLVVSEYPQLLAVGQDIVTLAESAINGTELSEDDKAKIRATQDLVDSALKDAVEKRLALGNQEV
jgi:hypothetical protein